MSQGFPGEIILDLGGPSSNDRCPYQEERRGEDTQGTRTREDRGRNWNDADTSLRIPGATGSWERQEGFSPWEIAWTCGHINFQTLASRAWREYISLF